MMKKRRGLSLGTILAIGLTILVSAGSFVMFTKMRAENTDVRMNAQKVAGVIGSVLSDNHTTPVPPNHVRTVTVTLAPHSSPPISSSGQDKVTEAPLPTATPTPVHYSFTMSLSGLIGFHSDISDSVAEESGKDMKYQQIFTYLSDEINSDLNVGILPHVINTEDSKYADVLAPAQILDSLKTAGFDDLLLNSEHALDQGVQGIRNTVDAIANRGFSCGGVNISAANQCRMIQLNSAKIAILAYTDALTTKGKNTLATQAGQDLMALFEPELVKQDIQAAKEQGANFVMVFLHWGKEDATTITKDQKNTAQTLAEMGADAIIGFHPSRVLPIEIIESIDKQGNRRETLVAYSMGSLLTESRIGYDISGILLHLDITCGSDGEVKFNRIEYTPTYIWRQNFNGNMQYRIVSSNQPPPDGMDKNQQEVMGRALNRIQNSLSGCPVIERKKN